MVNIRDYEVSIWTLQDSFIAVLKQSNLENKEKIQEPKMVLKDDGENSFSFKIPMYLKEDTDLSEEPYFKQESIWKENPIWYTVRNGNLIASLRKIKVIFNKGSKDEEVFEFIINNIKESHEGYSKFCEVECGGLAFHELGKQGYEIVLSDDVFLADYQDWIDGILQDEPIKNIDYWIKKVLDNSNWVYEVNMDWSQYDGITNKTKRIGNSSVRQSDKVYRDPYVSSWQLSNNRLVANSSVTDISQLEKKVTVEAKESNRYNLLQSIAEAFQVFCKFKYEYDDNYHIIGRKVIFYNNFINEAEGTIDFNYGYNTSQITREMDGTDLISKMYVSPLSDSGTFTGEINLSDTAANPTLDNFLLNFNYLYQIGTISQEQYDEIKVFQAALRNLNNQIKEKNEELIGYRNQEPLEDAKLKTAEDLSSEAGERINEAQSAIKSLQLDGANENTGLITIDGDAPRLFVIIHDSKSDSRYYININKSYRAFIPSTFELYKSVNANGAIVSNSQISKLQFERDEDGYISKVTFPIDNELSNLQQVYATFQYNPFTPYRDVIKIWTAIQGQANTDVENATKALYGDKNNNKLGLYTLIDNCESDLKTFAAERQELIKKFERLMGPALREGTWQPEDEYADYKTNKIFALANTKLTSINSSSDTTGIAAFKWDNNQLNYDEQKISYQFGEETRYYPCIDLSGFNNTVLSSINIDNLNLVFRDAYLGGYTTTYPSNDPRVNHYLQVGSDTGCKFAFIREKNTTTPTTVIPVLMIVGVKTMADAIVYNEGSPTSTVITVEDQVKRNARLSAITYSNGELIETEKISSLTNYWLDDLSNYEVVYPRFYVPIDNYITAEPENKIYMNNTALEELKDYYSLFHGLNYWITLKPESIIFNLSTNYSFHYAITNAAEAMYLDAVEILKENSVPKVSYTITPLVIEQSFMKNAYARLGQLAHINDQELKFENVQGYISEVNLDLDKPWEDSYTIKNYKTKFEDLFSTIVAQTEAMKKNSQLLNMVSNAFNTNGLLENAIVDDIRDRLNIYVPTPTEIYSQYEPQIREELQQAFTEAGEVLAAAQSSVNDINNLNIANATILRSFVNSLKNSLDKAAIDINKKEGYINIYANNFDNKETSLLKIDNKQGIYLGSNKSITFYSGEVGATNSGASGKISSERILFGVSDGSKGSVVDIKKDYVLLGSAKINKITGEPSEEDVANTGTATGTAGVKITQEYIRMAVGTAGASNRNYISMDANGVKIANATREGSGAQVVISQDGVLIGTAPEPDTTSQYITNIQNGSSTMDEYNGAKFQVYAPNFVVDSNGHLYAYEATITGSIKASSFELIGNAAIPSSKVTGLDTALSNLNDSVTAINAIRGTVTYAKSASGVLNNNNPPPDITSWSTTIPTLDTSKPFLWTKTITTYSSGATSTAYSVSYKGTDGAKGDKGDTGTYVTAITPLYSLKNTTTPPNKPSTKVTNSTTTGDWRTSIPTYQSGYYYFRCEQYEWSAGTSPTWSTPYIDYGITYAASTATTASTDAALARNIAEPFDTNGLKTNYWWPTGTGTSHTGGTLWQVALVSNGKLLIGANSGLWIAKSAAFSDGAAITIDKSGIAANGASITLNTSGSNSTNVISMNTNGITIGATKSLTVGSENFVVSNVSSGVAFRIGPASTPYLKYTIGTGLEVKGTIYATSGEIGGWFIGSNNLYYTNTYIRNLNISSMVTSESGLCPESSTNYPALWIGGIRAPSQLVASGESTSFSSQPTSYKAGDKYNNKYAIRANTTYNKDDWFPVAPFYVTRAGALHATGAVISGEITANSGAIGGSTGWKITSNYIYSSQLGNTASWSGFSASGKNGMVLYNSSTYSEIHLYTSQNNTTKNLLNINTDTSGSDDHFLFALGDYSGSGNYLAYTKGGKLKIKGELTAYSGSIGGWVIGDNYIGSANRRGKSVVGMSCVGNNDSSDESSSGSNYFAFWTGGSENETLGENFLDAKNTAFYVRKSGYVHISTGEILADYLMSKSNGTNRYPYVVYISSIAPTTSDFSIANRFALKHLLWINPSGTVTTEGGIKRTNCTIQWCSINS